MENPYGTTSILPNYYHNTNNNNNKINNNSSLSPHHLAISDSSEQQQQPPPIISSSSSSSSHSYTSSSPSSHYRPSSLNNYDSGGLYRANQIFSSISGPQLVAKQQQQQYQHFNNKQNELLIPEESNGSRFSMVSALSIVDPPRPPFIPKKPVFYSSTNVVNNKEILSNKNKNEEERKVKLATNYEDDLDFNNRNNGHQQKPPFLQQMQHSPKMKHSSKLNNNSNGSISIYHRNNPPPPPLPHRYHNQQNFNSSSPQHIYAPPITSTTVTTTAITTTYIGGKIPSINNSNEDSSCNCSENCSNKNEKCSNFSEKNSSTDGSTTNSCSNNENIYGESCYGNESSTGKDVLINNKLLKMGKPTCFEIAEKLGSNCTKNTKNCTSYFPVVEQKEDKEFKKELTNNNKNLFKNSPPSPHQLESSTSSVKAVAAALVTADLRARFRESQNNLNDKGKRHSSNCVLQQQQRRLSLVGAISDSNQMTFSSTATISSYGCSDAGKTREGRIYATAGFGAAAAARNRKKKLKNNNGIIENKNNEICEEENVKMRQEGSQTCLVNDNNQMNVSNLTSNKNDQNSFGTLKSNSGASIGAFSLGNEFIYETTGKSTLGRRAQKLAQRAALKLSKSRGTLSAELSSSASAIYALFSGNNSNNNGFVNEKCLNGENIRPGSDDFLLLGKKKGSKRKGRKKLEVISSTGCYWMDKTTLVSKHTAKGIDFLDSFGLFIKERAQIEEEYANKLKNLSKKSRGKKASDDEFTSSSAFHAVLGELESLASQHELVVECLRDVLLPKINDKCRQFRTVRKKHSQNFELMEKDYNAKVDELQKQKKNYEKAHVEAQNAHIKHKRAFENRYLSRHEVDKAQLAANNKSTICEQGKQNYASQLAATNQAKSDFYNILLPRLLEEMRQLEIERINFTREIMLESVKAETDVLHIKQRCYEDMNNAIKTVNPEHDTLLVVEQTKTGYTHPADFEFEDFGN
uniref:F-BAR domain-containing protein n=1 Tax=Meloidogyne enterolobii TaxID=390850 RepID=A0A6V7U5M3_MELEN|nr:unnamed protein product [Meloidogyne enterolobii]